MQSPCVLPAQALDSRDCVLELTKFSYLAAILGGRTGTETKQSIEALFCGRVRRFHYRRRTGMVRNIVMCRVISFMMLMMINSGNLDC
jgi:hypothetical protein